MLSKEEFLEREVLSELRDSTHPEDMNLHHLLTTDSAFREKCENIHAKLCMDMNASDVQQYRFIYQTLASGKVSIGWSYLADAFEPYIVVDQVTEEVQQAEFRMNIHSELKEWLGLIVLFFQQLEQDLSIAIKHFLGTEANLSNCLTAEMAFKNKVHAFSSLTKAAFATEEDIEEAELVIKRLWQAEEMRNRIIHSTWMHYKEDVFKRLKTTAKSKHGLRYAEEEVDISDLRNTAKFILDTLDSLGEVMTKHFVADWNV